MKISDLAHVCFDIEASFLEKEKGKEMARWNDLTNEYKFKNYEVIERLFKTRCELSDFINETKDQGPLSSMEIESGILIFSAIKVARLLIT